VLQDIRESLQRKQLLAVRTNEAGQGEVRSTPLGDDRFEIDPEFEALLPRAPDEVFALGRSDYPVVEMAFFDRDAVVAWLYATHYGRRSFS
jgi:hypothetical protein